MATVKTRLFTIIIYVLVLQTLQHGSSFPHLSSLIVHVSDIVRFQSQKSIVASPDLLLQIGQRTLPKDVCVKQILSLRVRMLRMVGTNATWLLLLHLSHFFPLSPKTCKLDQMLWRLHETWTTPTLASQFGAECSFEANLLIVPI